MIKINELLNSNLFISFCAGCLLILVYYLDNRRIDNKNVNMLDYFKLLVISTIITYSILFFKKNNTNTIIPTNINIGEPEF